MFDRELCQHTLYREQQFQPVHRVAQLVFGSIRFHPLCDHSQFRSIDFVVFHNGWKTRVATTIGKTATTTDAVVAIAAVVATIVIAVVVTVTVVDIVLCSLVVDVVAIGSG